MGVRNVEDLLCWQLAHELKLEVLHFTATGPAPRDFTYRDQIRDSARSATRNMAEGFKRYRPGDFARFLEFACGSLGETIDALRDALDSGFLTQAEYTRLRHLAEAAVRTTTKLLLQKKRAAAKSKKK